MTIETILEIFLRVLLIPSKKEFFGSRTYTYRDYRIIFYAVVYKECTQNFTQIAKFTGVDRQTVKTNIIDFNKRINAKKLSPETQSIISIFEEVKRHVEYKKLYDYSKTLGKYEEVLHDLTHQIEELKFVIDRYKNSIENIGKTLKIDFETLKT
jgi:predicted RNase H-like nuclease (RuvC/YqgF family)